MWTTPYKRHAHRLQDNRNTFWKPYQYTQMFRYQQSILRINHIFVPDLSSPPPLLIQSVWQQWGLRRVIRLSVFDRTSINSEIDIYGFRTYTQSPSPHQIARHVVSVECWYQSVIGLRMCAASKAIDQYVYLRINEPFFECRNFLNGFTSCNVTADEKISRDSGERGFLSCSFSSLFLRPWDLRCRKSQQFQIAVINSIVNLAARSITHSWMISVWA